MSERQGQRDHEVIRDALKANESFGSVFTAITELTDTEAVITVRMVKNSAMLDPETLEVKRQMFQQVYYAASYRISLSDLVQVPSFADPTIEISFKRKEG